MLKLGSTLVNVISEDVNKERIVILFKALTQETKKDGKVIKPKLSKEDFYKIVLADPTTKTNGVQLNDDTTIDELSKVKAGKYVQWMIKMYLTSPDVESSLDPNDPEYLRQVKEYKRVFIEDLYKLTDDLKKYDRFKQRLPDNQRDINNLTPDKLFQAVKDFDLSLASMTKSERASQEVHPGAKLGIETDDWKVIEISDKGPLGKEAACFYGGNNQETRWCTSAPGGSQFSYYIQKGPLYVILKKDGELSPSGLPKERYQFHFDTDQFMDKDDRRINVYNALNTTMSELKEYFKPMFVERLEDPGTNKLKIDNFKSGNVGLFISLYGLKELFENLSTNTTQIELYGDDDITFDVPDSISRLKELRTLTIQKSATRIPDSICELPKLSFISFSGCRFLSKIPDCIADMPSIAFVNLSDTSVKIPESFKEKAIDMGSGHYDFTSMDYED